MQVTIEIHPAFDKETGPLLEGVCNELKHRDNKIAQTISKEVRAQLWALDDDEGFHFFASSGLHWHTGTDLLEVLTRQRKADTNKRSAYQSKGCTVYRVPGPESRKYRINNYVPDVPGVTTVAEVRYDAKPPKR